MGLSHFQSSPDTWKVWRSISSNKKVEDKRAILCSPSVQAYLNWGLNVLFFRRSTLLLDDWWRYRSTRFWDEKSRSKMGLVRDFKVWVIGNILWFTGLCLFVCTCLLLRKPHFPDSGRLVCELTSRICAFAEVSCAHEGPAKIVPLTRRLRLHFLILVCGAF